MHSFSEKIRANDGTPLEVKEGVVLDREGNVLSAPEEEHPRGRHHAFREGFGAQPKVFVWKSNSLLTPLILAPIFVVLLAVGLTIFAGVAAVAFLAWVLFVIARWIRRF